MTEPPSCVLCGAPGSVGVGTTYVEHDEVWYCLDHIGAAFVHAAQPVTRSTTKGTQ